MFSSSDINEKIRSYIGQEKFEQQKNLIKVLFIQKDQFLNQEGFVDSIKVLEILKKNGLLKLFYEKPISLKIAFNTKSNSMIFLKVISEALEAIGYSYYLTESMTKNSDGLNWKISLQTEHIVDPVLLSQVLKKRGCEIEDITISEQHFWNYTISSKNAKVDAKSLELDTFVDLPKPIRPYWIDVKNMQTIVIKAHLADKWFPNVIFFDESLRVIKELKEETPTKGVKISIPIDCYYVKISDLYLLDNIKHGLSVQIKN